MDFIANFFWSMVHIMLWTFGAALAVVVLIMLYSSGKANDIEVARIAKLKSTEQVREKHLIRAKRIIEEIVHEHLDTLARRRMSMVRVDPYGIVDAAKWNLELQHFVDKVIAPKLNEVEKEAVYHQGINFLFQVMVEDRVRQRQEVLEEQLSSIEGLSPFEFENWCKIQFERLGWVARLTKAGADQGADVIIEKQGRTVVVQCKLYSRPVGNAAVQEIFAAKRFYGAIAAAVVTNASYTPSARALAGTTGVILLDHTGLELIDEIT